MSGLNARTRPPGCSTWPARASSETAIGADGTPYTALPNAFRYRTTFDPSCSCRRDGETWSEALSGAERLLGADRGDVIVDTQLARNSPSRRNCARRCVPKARLQATRMDQGDFEGDAFSEERDAAARAGEEAPTWGGDSAGIRIDGLEGERVISREEGQVSEQDASGLRARRPGARADRRTGTRPPPAEPDVSGSRAIKPCLDNRLPHFVGTRENEIR